MGLLDKLKKAGARHPDTGGLNPSDPCPCGSGKTIKACCGMAAVAAERQRSK